MNYSRVESAETIDYLANPPPLLVRLAYFISIWSFKSFIKLSLTVSRLYGRDTGSIKPKIKVYPGHPKLRNRIFIRPGLDTEKLPVYFDIHGGGFAVADPQTDDVFCSFLAENFDMIVVSVDYSKSPRQKFPRAVEDVEAIVEAVLEDPDLPIDKSKVVIGGFSAGGNLAFAASQKKSLHGSIKAVVGFYPALNFTQTVEEKLDHRPEGLGTDLLSSSAGFIDWGYVPVGQDRRDPRLSPVFADPESLPEYAFLVGAEYDMLCKEAEEMAEMLAFTPENDCVREAIKGLPAADGWEQGKIRWECARQREHAFTHIKKWGKKEKERVEACNSMYRRMGNWLEDIVFAGT
jgi:acetyl esterase/lipase